MTSLESFTSGETIPVDFTAIERELTSLWKEASLTESAAPGRPAVTRACQLNLIAFCASDEEAARATSTLAPVMDDCPSRVLMTIAAAVPRGLSAAISAHCVLVPDGIARRQVCCEQVTLSAGGESVEHLPGAVLPLLLPDLPVVLWLPGSVEPGRAGPAAVESQRRLAHLADRVIFDSRRLRHPAAAWRAVAALKRPVADLAWLRLAAWRELLSALFDGPRTAELTPFLRSVTVTRDGQGDDLAESLLLACWVASCLGWRATPAEGPPYRLARPDGATAEIRLEHSGHGGTPGGGRVVGLELHDGDAIFRLCRDGGKETLTGTVELPGTCPLPRTIRSVERSEATLLCRALHWGVDGQSPYDAAMRLAAELESPPTGSPS